MAKFKWALAAGHWKNNTSKRMPKEIDPKRTLEWALNMQVCRFIEAEAQHYPDMEIVRVDDLGETRVLVADRAAAANAAGADYILEVHHNSGIKLGKGGGVSIFYYRSDAKTLTEKIYESVIANGGIKGNRSTPIHKKGFTVIAKAKMPGTLIECGFMDSTVDGPIILTEAYSQKVAQGIVEAVAAHFGLERSDSPVVEDTPQAEEKPAEITEGTIVKFKDDATHYRPGGSYIASWAKNYHHVVTQVTSNGKPVVKDGVTCVLLGKKLEPGKTCETDQLHGINSWVDPNVLEIVGTVTPKPEVVFEIGDKVRMQKDAPNATSGKAFSDWVYNTVLYVRDLEADGVILVSSQKEGNKYTGRVHKQYLTKI